VDTATVNTFTQFCQFLGAVPYDGRTGRCCSSRPTTARLIGDVRVSVLKMSRPPCDTAGTHADISIHIMKSLIDDCCRVSLFHKKFNDNALTKHVGDSYFLAVRDGNLSGF
jgi:hypothetical protein